MRERILGAQIFAALMLAATAALLSISGRTGRPYADIQWLLTRSAAAEFDAINGSTTDNPADMMPL